MLVTYRNCKVANWLGEQDPAVAAAIVAAVVGFLSSLLAFPIKYWIDKRALRHRLRMEYEQQQRIANKDLIVRYLGRMLEACSSFNYRMWNLYKGAEQERYLKVGGDYSRENYYLDTMVHRFLAICVLLRGFEREALYLDRRLRGREDIELARLLTAMRWALTDAGLFDGLPYDAFRSSDHFFGDQLRQISEEVEVDGTVQTRRDIWQRAASSESVADVYEFFDGLSSSEERFRWDRLVVFHLFVMSFLNAYGDETQHTSVTDLTRIAKRVRHPMIVRNLLAWVPKLGLKKTESGKDLSRALRKLQTTEAPNAKA